MKVDQYIKQIADSVDILSAQIGNARIREMWRKDIKTRLSRLNGFVVEIQEAFGHIPEETESWETYEENKLTMEGVFDHERNDDSLQS